MSDTTNPRDEELREKLKVIYRKNQDDGGTFYHEAATDDIMQLIQEHDATREREHEQDLKVIYRAKTLEAAQGFALKRLSETARLAILTNPKQQTPTPEGIFRPSREESFDE